MNVVELALIKQITIGSNRGSTTSTAAAAPIRAERPDPR